MSDHEQRPVVDDPSALRPRPQYGEYATAEEQRARIAQPDLTWMLDTGQDPDSAPADGRTTTTSPVAAGPAAPDVVRRRRFIDRVATITLLVYGFVNVVSSVASMIDYDSYVSTVLRLLQVDGQLADPAAGRAWGVAAALVISIGWLLTAYLSWRSLSRGRVTWWIPLVAGIVFTFVSGALLMVPILGDATLWQAIVASTR